MLPGQEANSDNLGKFFDLQYNDGMLNVLVRLASTTYYFKIKKVLNYLFSGPIGRIS